MKCPSCNKTLKFEENTAFCQHGHEFGKMLGAYQIQKPAFKLKLEKFLKAFELWRSDVPKIAKEHLDDLPFSLESGEWQLKQDDLKLIMNLKLNKGKALDVGSWNGWLSNQLVNLGFEVEAMDTFISESDGLGAKVNFTNDWRTYQMPIDDIELFEDSYDLIVFNRNVGYFNDLEKALKKAKILLKPDGVLLLTGVSYVKDPSENVKKLKQAERDFKTKFDTPFFIHEYDGYFSKRHKQLLLDLNIELKIYSSRKVASMKHMFNAKKPIYYYGIYRNEGRV